MKSNRQVKIKNNGRGTKGGRPISMKDESNDELCWWVHMLRILLIGLKIRAIKVR